MAPQTKATTTHAHDIPSHFRALVAPAVGQSFNEVAEIQELPMNVDNLGDDEVLIRVAYAGINGGCETFRVRGEYDFKPLQQQTNFRLGADGVGTVVATGPNVDTLTKGDAVAFVGAAFAEYTTNPAKMVWKIPSASAEYVGLRISALTSLAMLEVTGAIAPGQTVLITAAAGGAGHFAVQIAKLKGCTVIGTCGSESKAEFLKKVCRCDHVINYKTTPTNVKAELQRLAPNGLDVVLEGVGGTMFQTALECLGPEGRLLQIGYISEYPHSSSSSSSSSAQEEDEQHIDLADLFWNRKIITRGKQTIYGNAWPKNREIHFAALQERLLQLVEKKQLVSVIDTSRTFVGLESIPDAIDYMLSGCTMGKVVVKVS